MLPVVGVSRTAGRNWANGCRTYAGQVVGFVAALDRLEVREISPGSCRRTSASSSPICSALA